MMKPVFEYEPLELEAGFRGASRKRYATRYILASRCVYTRRYLYARRKGMAAELFYEP